MEGDSGTDTKESVKDGQAIRECALLMEGRRRQLVWGSNWSQRSFDRR